MAQGQVEIIGLENLKAALTRSIPAELRPALLRAIATKPAQRAAAIARALFPYGSTGRTVRTIGVMKVKNAKQPYVEVGFRGQSLGYIYVSKAVITRKKRGSVKGTPWLFHRAGDRIEGTGKNEMKVDISRAIAKSLKKHGYAMR
jgi:hypothetical protein